jgi:hypothetical protein
MLRITGKRMRRLAAAGMVLAFGFPSVAVARGCEGRAWAAPGTWGPESKWRGAFFGYPRMQMAYRWDVGGNVETFVCTQGWGFDENHPRGGWFGTGCSKNGGEGKVPWGNNAASARFRAKTVGPNGVIVAWRCGDGGPRT